MSLLMDSQPGLKLSPWGRFLPGPAIFLFVIFLLLGGSAVFLAAKASADRARVRARAEAEARGLAVEQQLEQARSAADMLSAIASQNGGAIPNFQTIAGELFGTKPGLGTIELQPNGVVSDVVPREGHERAIGFNVLNDPIQGPDARAAMRKRGSTVTGPFMLNPGEPGLVVRAPFHRRGRDGQDTFQGFVSVSIRLREALARARVDELSKRGYDYVFFAPSSARQKAVTIAAQGGTSLSGTEQQRVLFHELEFRLALKPRSGWMNKTSMVFNSLLALSFSGLLLLVVLLLENRRAIETELAGHRQRPGGETKDRQQAQGELRREQEKALVLDTELKQARSALQQADSRAKEAEARLEVSAAHGDKLRTELNQAELTIGELRKRLDEALRDAAAPPKQTELEEVQRVNRELQIQLEAISQREVEAIAAAQRENRQNQKAVTELQARLEAAMRLTKETAEVGAAELARSEEQNQELRKRLATAEKANDQVLELTTLLQRAEAELKSLREMQTKPPATEAAAPVPVPGPDPEEKESERQPATLANGEANTPAQPRPSEESGSGVAKSLTRAPKNKPTKRDNQMSLFVEPSVAPEPATASTKTQPGKDLAPDSETEAAPNEHRPAPPRRLPPSPPLNPGQLRKAVGQIVPLLTGEDPGAKECLRDNRETFRSAFTPEAYSEFEQLVKGAHFAFALEQLKKAAKKHGIPL